MRSFLAIVLSIVLVSQFCQIKVFAIDDNAVVEQETQTDNIEQVEEHYEEEQFEEEQLEEKQLAEEQFDQIPLDDSDYTEYIPTDITGEIGVSEHIFSDILNVTVPLYLDYKMNLLGLNGKPPIESTTQEIVNLGATPVLIKFTEVNVNFANDADFEAMAVPFDDTYYSGKKSIFLQLDFGNNDSESLVLTDENALDSFGGVVLTEEGTTGAVTYLNINGCITRNSPILWEHGDLNIVVNYQLIPILPEDKSIAQNTMHVDTTDKDSGTDLIEDQFNEEEQDLSEQNDESKEDEGVDSAEGSSETNLTEEQPAENNQDSDEQFDESEADEAGETDSSEEQFDEEDQNSVGPNED